MLKLVGDEDSIPLRFNATLAKKTQYQCHQLLSSVQKTREKKMAQKQLLVLLRKSMPFVSFFPTCMEEDIVNVEISGRLDVKIKE